MDANAGYRTGAAQWRGDGLRFGKRGALSFSGDRQRTMRQPLTIHGNGTARTGRNTPTLGRHRGRCTRWLTIVAVAGSFSLVALPTIISPALTTRGNGMAKRGLRWPIPGRHDVQRQRWPLTASEGEPCCSEDTTARSASVTPGLGMAPVGRRNRTRVLQVAM